MKAVKIWWDILHAILAVVVSDHNIDLEPISRFFHRNSNFREISFYSHPSCREVIAMKFCTWQDSFAVMPCAQFCSDMIPCNGVTLKPVFHKIWITMKISFMKWVLGYSGLVPPAAFWKYTPLWSRWHHCMETFLLLALCSIPLTKGL